MGGAPTRTHGNQLRDNRTTLVDNGDVDTSSTSRLCAGSICKQPEDESALRTSVE
jgi:hypothetical protein